MSERSISTFAKNSEAYVNCENFSNCLERKELLNSVNRSNINNTVVTNYGEGQEGFTTLLHAAIQHGDKFMCERLISIPQLKLDAQDSRGENANDLMAKLKSEGDGANRAILAIEAFLNPKKNQKTEEVTMLKSCWKKFQRLWC